MNAPFPPPLPQGGRLDQLATEREIRKPANSSSIISKILMWVAWGSTGAISILSAFFIVPDTPKLNSFAGPFGIFEIGIFAIPIFVCIGCRFWLSRTVHPWIALIPFSIGLFFAWQTAYFGIFLVPTLCIVFQLLSAAFYVLYLPLFVRLSQKAN